MGRFLVNLFGISFLLNFVWEISQMGLYAMSGMGIRSDYGQFLAIHWQVSLKDALMVVAMYAIVAILMRRWDWAADVHYGWAIFVVGLVSWQTAIECYSVYVAGRWAYAPAMPLLFGIGFAPLAQMALLPLIALLWARLSLRK
ncbi:MAG: hypothetical protein KGI60_04060 [Patescibacteria group bacterium]|nr:hypothetical protein [Patescibacteria group bacterium]